MVVYCVCVWLSVGMCFVCECDSFGLNVLCVVIDVLRLCLKFDDFAI